MKESRRAQKERTIKRKQDQRAKMVQQDLTFSILASESKQERESAYNYNMSI